MVACEWSLRVGPWELERCRRLAGLSRPGRDRALAGSSSCGVAGGWGSADPAGYRSRSTAAAV